MLWKWLICCVLLLLGYHVSTAITAVLTDQIEYYGICRKVTYKNTVKSVFGVR